MDKIHRLKKLQEELDDLDKKMRDAVINPIPDSVYGPIYFKSVELQEQIANIIRNEL